VIIRFVKQNMPLAFPFTAYGAVARALPEW